MGKRERIGGVGGSPVQSRVPISSSDVSVDISGNLPSKITTKNEVCSMETQNNSEIPAACFIPGTVPLESPLNTQSSPSGPGTAGEVPWMNPPWPPDVKGE